MKKLPKKKKVLTPIMVGGVLGLSAILGSTYMQHDAYEQSKKYQVNVGDQSFQYTDREFQQKRYILDGKSYSLSSKPDDVKEEIAHALIGAFYQKKSVSDFFPKESVTVFDYETLDTNKDGLLHLYNQATFYPQQIVLYPESSQVWIITDGKQQKLFEMGNVLGSLSISTSAIRNAVAREQVTSLKNDIDKTTVYIDKQLFGQGNSRLPTITTNSTQVQNTRGGHIISTPETDDLFYLPYCGIISKHDLELHCLPLLSKGKQQLPAYDVYSAMRHDAQNGMEVLERILAGSQIRSLVFGELHESKEFGHTHIEFLTTAIPLFKRYNCTLGIELDNDEVIEDTHKKSTIKELLECYNNSLQSVDQQKLEGTQEQPNFDQLVYYLNKYLGKKTHELIKQTHAAGMEVVAIEHRNMIYDSYQKALKSHVIQGGSSEGFNKNPVGFITRDTIMCQTAVEYLLQHPEKKLLLLVGKRHASGEATPRVIRATIPQNKVNQGATFDYIESHPLGYQLRQQLGSEKVALIGLYHLNSMTPALARTGVMHDKDYAAQMIMREIECIKMHSQLATDSHVLRYDPHRFEFFDSSVDHALVILQK